MSLTDPKDAWLQLPPEVHFQICDGRLLIVTEDAAMEVHGDLQAAELILNALRQGASRAHLRTLAPERQVVALLAELATRRWLLTEPLRPGEAGQFEQVVRWLGCGTTRPSNALAALRTARVGVLGAGGLGGEVAQHLAGAGVGLIVLVDGDRVEVSNLNRQFLYDHGALGRLKVEVAAERLLARSPKMRVRAIARYIESESDLTALDGDDLDVLVQCADQPADLDRMVGAYCARRRLTWITGGAGVNRGYWGPLFVRPEPEDLPRFEQALAALRPPALAGWDGSLPCSASHAPYNSILAGHLASDVIAYITGVKVPHALGRRMIVDFDRLTVTAGADILSSGEPPYADAVEAAGSARDRR